jgi:transmembrane sensor
VVADLNRYFPETISVADADVAGLRFSGVLVVDKEDPLIRRIEALLPVSADRSNGAIVFRAEREAR